VTTALSAWISGVNLLEPLHLAQLHAAVLGFPAVVRLLRDAVRPTQIRDLPPRFAFLDDRENLRVGDFPPLHRSEQTITPAAESV